VQFGSSNFQPPDLFFQGPAALNVSRRRSPVQSVNAEPKTNDSIVPCAATVFADDVVDKAVKVEDIEKLALDLQKASPLEIIEEGNLATGRVEEELF
ncbi:hypothetical protein M8C21_018755, partial [Ambrosia artemisiifolia]